jgi:hypothetical protein
MRGRRGEFAVYERVGDGQRQMMEGGSLEEIVEKLGEKTGLEFRPGFGWEVDE